MDSFCDSRIRGSFREAGGAAAAAEKNKQSKYAHLDRSYVFQPIAVEAHLGCNVQLHYLY